MALKRLRKELSDIKDSGNCYFDVELED